ncbi:hypothetical protein QJS04_geneDACA011947 [Acorus gramineus]|uniref:Uncharacterized protein n=1 Tax=Acorus gramineus TaxID=55184 RepID=A0AAV9AJ73_ACOGR|nr:hypothetical protein QJS04_geneDACA011947 [Acorus gramineus]
MEAPLAIYIFFSVTEEQTQGKCFNRLDQSSGCFERFHLVGGIRTHQVSRTSSACEGPWGSWDLEKKSQGQDRGDEGWRKARKAQNLISILNLSFGIGNALISNFPKQICLEKGIQSCSREIENRKKDAASLNGHRQEKAI